MLTVRTLVSLAGALAAVAGSAGSAWAQSAPPPSSEASPPSSLYSQVGTVTKRSAAGLAAAGTSSPFSIGAETTDRGFSTFANWDDYLGPLGMPAARVQTGWADIERTRGTYTFTRLDAIVAGMKQRSVQPWLNLMYGNPLYSGGGDPELSGEIPTAGSTGYTKWLDFVRATVARYDTSARKVTEWEIWNEPDSVNAADAYASFAADTAKAIKSVQPEAKILLGGFKGNVVTTELAYAREVIDDFAAQKGSTVPSADVAVTYHPYRENPDDTYDSVFDDFRAAAAAKGFSIRQGENGAPSRNQPEFALSGLPWTETAQGKYALRRLLGDFHRSIPSSLFTLVDLHYTNAKNSKGLLLTGAWSNDPPTYGDQTVQRPKVGYPAVQALTAVFDNRLQLLTGQGCSVPTGYTIHAYSRLDSGGIRRNMLVVWRNTDRPGANQAPADIDITCTTFRFPRYLSEPSLRPRFTDLLPAKVYGLRSADTVVHPAGGGVRIRGLRVYDSPVVLADQGIVPVTP